MLKPFKADLHLHTCLSPCAEADMTPRRVVERSLEAGLDMIAICDHNTAENAGAALRHGRRCGLCVLPGMELCSREEVHLLAIFPALTATLRMQRYVYDHLEGFNRPEIFGPQTIVDESERCQGENPRLLIGALRLGLDQLVDRIRTLSGVAIAAHIDRRAYGIVNQLGFVPADLALAALELSPLTPLTETRQRFPDLPDLPLVTSSDAHRPADIGRVWTVFVMHAPTFAELRLALAGRGRRGIEA